MYLRLFFYYRSTIFIGHTLTLQLQFKFQPFALNGLPVIDNYLKRWSHYTTSEYSTPCINFIVGINWAM